MSFLIRWKRRSRWSLLQLLLLSCLMSVSDGILDLANTHHVFDLCGLHGVINDVKLVVVGPRSQLHAVHGSSQLAFRSLTFCVRCLGLRLIDR